MPWAAMADITISRENIGLAKKAGCIGLKFGVESADPIVLKDMHKGIVTADKTLAYRRLLREMGIWAHATFTFGHPRDTLESMESTLKFSLKLDPDSVQYTIVTPLPGTPFYYECKEKGWLSTEDYSRFDGNNFGVVDTVNFTHKDVERIHDLAFKEWSRNIRTPRHLGHFIPLSLRTKGVLPTAQTITRRAISDRKGYTRGRGDTPT